MNELYSPLSWSEIAEMIARQQPETRALEFKMEIADSHELRRDVTALANSGGGRLILGVLDGDGKAGALAGATPRGVSKMKQQAKEMLARNIEPPINFDLYGVEAPTHDVGVLVIEVSAAAQPHAVEIAQDVPHEYWTRRVDSKRPMRPSEVQRALERADDDPSPLQTALTARALWELRMMRVWEYSPFDRPDTLTEHLAAVSALVHASNRAVVVISEVAERLSIELTDRIPRGGMFGAYRLASNCFLGLLDELPTRHGPGALRAASPVWDQAAEFGLMLSYHGSRRLGGNERGQQLLIALGARVLGEVRSWGSEHGITDAVRVATAHATDQLRHYDGELRACFDFALSSWESNGGLAAESVPELMLSAVFNASDETPIEMTRRRRAGAVLT